MFLLESGRVLEIEFSSLGGVSVGLVEDVVFLWFEAGGGGFAGAGAGAVDEGGEVGCEG